MPNLRTTKLEQVPSDAELFANIVSKCSNVSPR